ncbi:Spo0E family sporulation regulatory protein-aspartic acid phosphatase [Schinkia sp. CFF1]
MSDIVVKLALAEEIEQLRRQLGEEWKRNHILSNPTIVQLSQRLDVKISQYQRLTKE